jgi:Flp pilus assembly protein TadG
MIAALRARVRRRLADETGSAVAEFVMVAGLLTVLTLSVIQLGLALLVRNTVLDAAAEGARFASLADNTLADGRTRTHDLIASAIGAGYAQHITAGYDQYLGQEAVTITVRTPLPLIGLIGLNSGLEVTGHAAVETLDAAVARR